jgi:hypothetical protein
MSVQETLKAARALISEPDYWCVRYLSKLGPRGQMQYCAIGAIQQVAVRSTWEAALDTLSKVAAQRLGVSYSGMIIGAHIAEYNNSHTHAEVLSMFDEAIASLEPKPLPDCLTAKIMTVPERELEPA